MLRFQKYARPETPEEAFELVQSDRLATVVGGMMWLRLSSRTAPLGIDLSACGLDRIEETEGAFRIGAMVTLGQLERHEAFRRATSDVFTEAVRDIVGAPFRNSATVGGSVWARMGFSDIVTALLTLDCEVELVGAGRVTLPYFVERGAGRDVLTHVIVHKHRYRGAFECVRNSATDFSAVNVAASCWRGSWHVAVGARPQKAQLVAGADAVPLPERYSEAEMDSVCEAVEDLGFGSDLRASEKWRRRVAPGLVRRAVERAAQKQSAPSAEEALA